MVTHDEFDAVNNDTWSELATIKFLLIKHNLTTPQEYNRIKLKMSQFLDQELAKAKEEIIKRMINEEPKLGPVIKQLRDEGKL